MSLNALPANSRLWLLALQDPPVPAVEARLRQGLGEIVGQWRHKGLAYQGVGTLLEAQLIAVAEPSLAAHPSGCAIDGMLRKIQRLVEQLDLALVDSGTSILVRQGGRLTCIAKPDIQARLEDGTLDAATPVLDLSLYSLGDLREGRLEAPLASTWVGRKHRVAVDA